MKIFLFFVLLLIVSATAYTRTYNNWKAGTFKDTLFLLDTYLPFHDSQLNRETACRVLNDDQSTLRTQFIAMLTESGIACTGTWCRNHDFSCSGTAPMGACYNVEHIIDRANKDPDLSGMNVNIVGNLIMAYGVWNGEVGSASIPWADKVDEKQKVYTTYLYQTAKRFVIDCHIEDSTSTGVPVESDSHNSETSVIVITIIVGIILGIFVICSCNPLVNRKPEITES